MKSLPLILAHSLFFVGCYSTPGPDKSAAGAVLGAGWGTGVGAVVGNQIGSVGSGMAVGAAFGLADGLITGITHDLAEEKMLGYEDRLKLIEEKISVQETMLEQLQYHLDRNGRGKLVLPAVQQIYFDEGSSSLLAGSEQKIESIARFVRESSYVRGIKLRGYTEFTKKPEESQKISSDRATTVKRSLVARGIDSSKIEIETLRNPVLPISETNRELNRRVEIEYIF